MSQQYNQLKRHYIKLVKDGFPTDDKFLCMTENGTWGEYTATQKGYSKATERTPVPVAKTCEHCDQIVPIPDDTLQADIDKKVEKYRLKLEKV